MYLKTTVNFAFADLIIKDLLIFYSLMCIEVQLNYFEDFFKRWDYENIQGIAKFIEKKPNFVSFSRGP